MKEDKDQFNPITYKDLCGQLESNRTKLKDDLVKTNIVFEELFDIQQHLFYNYFPGVVDPYFEVRPSHKVVVQGYLKNIYLLLTSHELMLTGNHGASIILTRQVLEFLVLSKYLMVTGNDKLANRWLNGSQVSFYKDVLKLFINPLNTEFFELWKMLSTYSHATTSSYQVSFNVNDQIENVIGNRIIILMLLRGNYHLLNRHLINNQLRYRGDRYGDKIKNKRLREKASIHLKKIRSLLSPQGKNFIDDYETQWSFK